MTEKEINEEINHALSYVFSALGDVRQYDLVGLLRFIQKHYTYEYSEEVNTWGYKHKERGWHVFGNVYTEKEIIDDFVRGNSL